MTNDIENADYIFLNTCGLTQKSEEKSLKLIEQLKIAKRPTAKLIVFGCLSRANKNLFKTVYTGNAYGSDDIEKVTNILETKSNINEIHANYITPFTSDIGGFNKRIIWKKLKEIEGFRDIENKIIRAYYNRFYRAIDVIRPYSFPIKVSTGCLANCSFCVVKLTRGKVLSKPIQRIAKEFDEGLAKGYLEFSLIGTDVGSYGRDLDINLIDLLQELISRKGNFKIRLRNIQPKFLIEMMPELQKIFMSSKISYLSTAVQSGNNRILKLMNRGYSIEAYKEAIRTINKNFPYIQIRTQFMVGFPSETYKEFMDTFRLLEELIFDITEVYIYSPRINTKAATMENQIPLKITKKRYYKIYRRILFNQLKRKKFALKQHRISLKSWSI